MEFVGPSKRVLISNVMCCMYAIGEIFLALCAMWFRSWRKILYVFYVPGFLAIFIPFLVPESVRYECDIQSNLRSRRVIVSVN